MIRDPHCTGQEHHEHDPTICGISAYLDCDPCRAVQAAGDYRNRPGPQPTNQIAGTAAEQLARAHSGWTPPPPHHEAEHLSRVLVAHSDLLVQALRPVIESIVLDLLAAQLPEAIALLIGGAAA